MDIKNSQNGQICQDATRKDYSQFVFWRNNICKNQEEKIMEEDFKKHVLKEGMLQNYTFPFLKFQKRQTQSNLCAKVIPQGYNAYKCYDCMYNSACVFCVQCFEKSNHQGHVYQLAYTSGNGCCDCGDQSIWSPKGFCFKHSQSKVAQQIRLQIDQKQHSQFFDKLGFCFRFYLNLHLELKNSFNIHEFIKKKSQNQISHEQKVNLVDQFGSSLLSYLVEFNKGSFTSNIMTSDLFTENNYQIEEQKKQKTNKSLLEILLDLKNIPKTTEKLVALIFSLFTVKQFKYFLAIVYSKKCYQNYQFSRSSNWSSLSCQIYTNSQLIKDLINKKQLKPLKFLPNIDQIKDFQTYTTTVLGYYTDVNFILGLSQEAAQIYFKFYIEQGCLQSLAYHRVVGYHFQDAIDYYKIQKYYLDKFVKLLKVLSKSKNSLQLLQMTILKLFQHILKIYQNNIKDFFQKCYPLSQYAYYLYITHQISFSLAVFTYFQKLQQLSQEKYDQNKKIEKLIQILKVKFNHQIQYQTTFNMLLVIFNTFYYSSLIIAHSKLTQQYYNYHHVTHNYQAYSTLSSTIYLFKITLKMHNRLRIYIEEQSKGQFNQSLQESLANNFFFNGSLKSIKKLLEMVNNNLQFNFIQRFIKFTPQLGYFINLLIQATQTDIHELIVAMMLGFAQKTKYSSMTFKFYLQVLKIYKKINLKDFKEIVDKFFICDNLFQQFVMKSKDIVINNGKIILKQYIEEQIKLKKMNEEKVQNKIGEQKTAENINKSFTSKILSQINIYYFPQFKYKIQAISTSFNSIKVPQSSNHFLSDIFCLKYIEQLCDVILSLFEKIVSYQNIKQSQTEPLNLIIIQIIKINRAFKLSASNDPSSIKIIQFLNTIDKNQQYIIVLSEQIKKLIIQEIQLTQQSQKKLNEIQKNKQKKSWN